MEISDIPESDKINLNYSNGQIFVWSAKDAFKLRTEHRIVGKLVGPYPGRIYQITENGLPLQLLKEEARLLIDIGVANLIKVDHQYSQKMVEEFKKHLESTRKDYIKLADERRLEEIKFHRLKRSDGVRKGKKGKKFLKTDDGDDGDDEKKEDEKMYQESDGNIDLNGELESVKSDLFPVQLFTECPWPCSSLVINKEWCYPQDEREKMMYKIFKDLWNRGHYITSGFKFGCDYLVYEYDPMVTHATYMVTCKAQEDLTALQVLILSRVSTQVNKQLLIASIISDKKVTNDSGESVDCDDKERGKPVYMSFKWQGNQDSPFKRFNKALASS